MNKAISKTLFYKFLSDDIDLQKVITKIEAEVIFNFFKKSILFRWHDANNDCEDRANAICILLVNGKFPTIKDGF